MKISILLTRTQTEGGRDGDELRVLLGSTWNASSASFSERGEELSAALVSDPRREDESQTRGTRSGLPSSSPSFPRPRPFLTGITTSRRAYREENPEPEAVDFCFPRLDGSRDEASVTERKPTTKYRLFFCSSRSPKYVSDQVRTQSEMSKPATQSGVRGDSSSTPLSGAGGETDDTNPDASRSSSNSFERFLPRTKRWKKSALLFVSLSFPLFGSFCFLITSHFFFWCRFWFRFGWGGEECGVGGGAITNKTVGKRVWTNKSFGRLPDYGDKRKSKNLTQSINACFSVFPSL